VGKESEGSEFEGERKRMALECAAPEKTRMEQKTCRKGSKRWGIATWPTKGPERVERRVQEKNLEWPQSEHCRTPLKGLGLERQKKTILLNLKGSGDEGNLWSET